LWSWSFISGVVRRLLPALFLRLAIHERQHVGITVIVARAQLDVAHSLLPALLWEGELAGKQRTCFLAHKVAVRAAASGRLSPPIAGHADATGGSAHGGESGVCEVGAARAARARRGRSVQKQRGMTKWQKSSFYSARRLSKTKSELS
jgi:hypothetical protein